MTKIETEITLFHEQYCIHTYLVSLAHFCREIIFKPIYSYSSYAHNAHIVRGFVNGTAYFKAHFPNKWDENSSAQSQNHDFFLLNMERINLFI